MKFLRFKRTAMGKGNILLQLHIRQIDDVILECIIGSQLVVCGTPDCRIAIYVTNGSQDSAAWTQVSALQLGSIRDGDDPPYMY